MFASGASVDGNEKKQGTCATLRISTSSSIRGEIEGGFGKQGHDMAVVTAAARETTKSNISLGTSCLAYPVCSSVFTNHVREDIPR